MCGVKLNLKNYYLHDKLPNDSIMSMLSYLFKNNNDISKKYNSFIRYLHDESVSFGVRNYL